MANQTLAFGGELTVRTLNATGDVIGEQTFLNTFTHRALDYMVKWSFGFVGHDTSTTGVALLPDLSIGTTNVGNAKYNTFVGTTIGQGLRFMNGAARAFKTTDVSQSGTANMLLNPFHYIFFSTAAVAAVASDDTVPGTILSTLALTDANLNCAVFADAARVGLQFDRSFAAGAVNGTVGSIGFCNYTDGRGLGTHAVLPAPIAAVSNPWTMTYRVFANK